ncbi:Peptidyl-prolyl cis-trans isomerase C [Stieleria neptunia]|uniref:Peptidyl-prolyl cis-trans isomerase C n=1 Tax=Stieleria neptunia TaxID=2527979 RepID=A0A518HMX3_9BACT|nr:peptidylprolyl isomerase [Stieleria neptunia]QDV42193.1 Peptidyl-prolyl cis-trans isomerase C [Stieleria neptunia]
MLRIKARHIQVSSPELANEVMVKWQQGANFEELARAYSECPTARQGGSLGEFGPGHMAPELEPVFLQGDVGDVYGPVATANGYHLVEVLERTDYE